MTDPLSEELRKLCTELRDHGFELPGRVEEFLARMDDPEMLVDSIAHSFIRNPIARQCIFEVWHSMQCVVYSNWPRVGATAD